MRNDFEAKARQNRTTLLCLLALGIAATLYPSSLWLFVVVGAALVIARLAFG